MRNTITARRFMDHGILVVDVPEHATAVEAIRALNATGESYSLVQVLPVPGAHRAYLCRYKPTPRIGVKRAVRNRDSSQAIAFARTTAAVRAAFVPQETVRYHPTLGAESTFYRWKKWALRNGILVVNRGKTYLVATAAAS
jgi:hypothetical protein